MPDSETSTAMRTNSLSFRDTVRALYPKASARWRGRAPGRRGWSRRGWSRRGWSRRGWSRRGWSRRGWSRRGWSRCGWSRRGWSRRGWSRRGWSRRGWSRGRARIRVVAIRVRVAMALAACAAALWASSAHAEQVGLIVRASRDAPVAPGELSEVMTRAGASAGHEVRVDPAARARARLAEGRGPAARLAELERIAALVRMGWQAYLAVEPALAADRLGQARSLAESVLDLPEGVVAYADACLRLGVVLRQLGRSEEGDALMRLATLLDPQREVSIAEFAPDVVTAYESARSAQVAAVPVRIAVTLDAASGPASEASPETNIEASPQPSIDASPETSPEASIDVDGRAAGIAPLELALATGLHVITARAPGWRSQARVIAVTPGLAPVDIALAPDPLALAVLGGERFLSVGSAGEAPRAAVLGVLVYAELDAVVLGASVWRRGQPALLGQRCAARGQDALACTSVIEIGYQDAGGLDAAARALWSALATQRDETAVPGPTLLADARLVQAEQRPAPIRAGGSGGPRWYRNRWLWIGAGVAAAAAAGTVWALARDPGADPVVVVDPCQFGPCP
jgi:hypothetical protein